MAYRVLIFALILPRTNQQIDVSFCTGSFKTIVGLIFTKLSFKVASAHILQQNSDIC